jgi:nicotinamide-nucleotide amidase
MSPAAEAKTSHGAASAGLWQIAVGDELLEGRTVDSNSRRVQRALGGGLRARGIQVVPDRPAEIVAALDRTAPGGLVVVTGGLGSTPDDRTREAVAQWASVPLPENAGLRAELEERAHRRGLRAKAVFAALASQAQVPAGLTPLRNPVGSAPGLVGELRGRLLVVLPGVPAELEGLLPGVIAWLRERVALPVDSPVELWRTAQRGELAVVASCAPVRERHPELAWSWWLSRWGVDVRIAAPGATSGGPAPGHLAAAAAELAPLLDPVSYGRDAAVELPAAVHARLQRRGATVGVAESCTGGLLAATLTDTPGASRSFRGAIVSYADDVKVSQLAVAGELLRRHGAVSGPVAEAMATGVQERLGVDYALAVTGIAGPDGGTDAKPVGTTWIGLATPSAVWTRRYRFPADRERNRDLAVAAALDTLRRALDDADPSALWLAGDSWAASDPSGGGR